MKVLEQYKPQVLHLLELELFSLQIKLLLVLVSDSDQQILHRLQIGIVYQHERVIQH